MADEKAQTFEEWWKQTLWSQLEPGEREEAKARKAFEAGRASMKAEAVLTCRRREQSPLCQSCCDAIAVIKP